MIHELVIDIETCPIDLDTYEDLSDTERLKLLNSIDSRIVAIGIRYNKKNIIINDLSEELLLKNFWQTIKNIVSQDRFHFIGFNVVTFDIPFIISKSLVYDVVIVPFTIKDIIDVRDKINAYKYGQVKGKMKEYAKLIGMNVLDVNGSDVALLYKNKKYNDIKKYLEHDLLITETLYNRCVHTKIININKW